MEYNTDQITLGVNDVYNCSLIPWESYQTLQSQFKRYHHVLEQIQKQWGTTIYVAVRDKAGDLILRKTCLSVELCARLLIWAQQLLKLKW